jgi:AraC family transcriptional regulator of adaptative response/methylated-DNA-[protein]-cysteine methyltransferase
MPNLKPRSSKPTRKSFEEFGFAVGRSSVGHVVACVSEFGVAAIVIRDDPEDLVPALAERFPDMRLSENAWEAGAVLAKVLDLIEHPASEFDLPLKMHGTLFQRKVWKAVQQIPAGQTTTYSEIARRIGRPRAVRAVGSACTQNPFAFAVPCHRVLHTAPTLEAALAKSSRRHRALIAREIALTGKT